jgi:hypothetical protein
MYGLNGGGDLYCAFFIMTPCSLVGGYSHKRETQWRQDPPFRPIQPVHFPVWPTSTLKMTAAESSDKLLTTYETTRCYKPERRNVHIHNRESLKHIWMWAIHTYIGAIYNTTKGTAGLLYAFYVIWRQVGCGPVWAGGVSLWINVWLVELPSDWRTFVPPTLFNNVLCIGLWNYW